MNREEKRKVQFGKGKKKLPKKTADEIRAEGHQNLMNAIISKTFTRHAELNEKDYLKAIGFEKTNKTEEEAVNIAMFNVMAEATKVLLKLEGNFNIATNIFRDFMLDNDLAQVDENENNLIEE